MPWTEEQSRAITLGGNLIVSAAAGAGKTAVLTERIATRIADGTPVEQMLVLTFTRAAAAEMKGRIAARLSRLSQNAATREERLYLLEQSRAVGGAYISTVHAFCARILRRHYHVLGLAPDARVADATECAVIADGVKDALLTALAAEENADWRRLLAAFGGESAAWDAVFGTYTFLQSRPDGENWLADAAAQYATEAGQTALLSTVVADCKQSLSLSLDALKRERDRLFPDGMEKALGVIDDALMRCRALLLAADYDAYREGLLDLTFSRLTFPRDLSDADKAPVRDARDAVKDLVKAQCKLLARPCEAERAVMDRASNAIGSLYALVTAFSAAFADEKRRRNVFDFNDLEHFALLLLGRPEIADEYRRKFAFIAVDEYQDSNRVQEAIVNAIRRPDNLFLVGDVKQSIYRFRQAEPALFLEKLGAFTGEAGTRLDLNANFRSDEHVLSAVNDVFSVIMTRAAGELDYDERARLNFGGSETGGGAELHIVSRELEDADDALLCAADAEVEGRLVAARIRELMESAPVRDRVTGELRRAQYADFAVLLRATTHAQLIAQTLSQCGVPCYAQLNGGYFDAVEVQVFLNLLRVIDNRRQDVPLISVLLSGAGDFSAEELLLVRTAHRGGSFFDAFYAARETNEKVAAFLEKLARWHAESLLVSVESLVGLLLDETGFCEEMGAGSGGRQRRANLNALLDRAHAFEASGAHGLSGFLAHMDLARSNASVGAAQTAGADVVRILTIHKSKGLEFPIVFVLQLGSRFNTSQTGALALHAARGVGLRLLDPQTRVYSDTAVRLSILERIRMEQIAEEMRVLYVAMTRARSRLILVGCMRDPADKLARAKTDPAPYDVLRCAAPIQWLLMGTRTHLPVTLHARDAWLEAPKEASLPPLPPPDPALLAALETRLSWSYPFLSATSLPAKATVSRIAASGAVLPLTRDDGGALLAKTARAPEFRLPAFLEGAKPSAGFAGTAAHAALERLSPACRLLPQDVPAFLSDLAARRYITAEQLAAVDPAQIGWYVTTPLYARMLESPRVEQELPFAFSADAAAVFDTDAEERVLLQGVIDCCYLENGAWVLVDYKTDRVPTGVDARDLALRHSAQLALYATALAALTGLPVREKYIVLLSAREIVAM